MLCGSVSLIFVFNDTATTEIYTSLHSRSHPDALPIVLNRVRHPAFPKTVCGVVFQGSERSTGCQFTFTCDGALTRRFSDAAWDRARDIAKAALTGHVAKAVGYATHYHTDWVVPYWSRSEERGVGEECVRAGKYGGWPDK